MLFFSRPCVFPRHACSLKMGMMVSLHASCNKTVCSLFIGLKTVWRRRGVFAGNISKSANCAQTLTGRRRRRSPFAERVSLALLGSAEWDGVPRETHSMSSILRARRVRHGPRTRARPGGCAAEPGSDVTDRAAAERKRAAHKKKNTTILCNTWYIRFRIRSVCSIPIAVFEMHFM